MPHLDPENDQNDDQPEDEDEEGDDDDDDGANVVLGSVARTQLVNNFFI